MTPYFSCQSISSGFGFVDGLLSRFNPLTIKDVCIYIRTEAGVWYVSRGGWVPS